MILQVHENKNTYIKIFLPQNPKTPKPQNPESQLDWKATLSNGKGEEEEETWTKRTEKLRETMKLKTCEFFVFLLMLQNLGLIRSQSVKDSLSACCTDHYVYRLGWLHCSGASPPRVDSSV